MKQINLKITALVVVLFSISNFSTAQKILLTVPQDEKILYAESYLSFFYTDEGIQVCTVDQNGAYYLYRNSKKQGPFKDINDAVDQIVYQEDEDYLDDWMNGRPENQNRNRDYISIDGVSNRYYINFNGKKSGPYYFVKDFFLQPGGKGFIAVVAMLQDDYSQPPKYMLISSGKPGIEMKGEPSELRVSRSVKSAVVTTMFEERPEIDMDALNKQNEKIMEMAKRMEEGEMSMEEMQKFAAEMDNMNKQTKQATKEYYVYTLDGKVFGPGKKNYFSSNNPGFGINSGERWHLLADGKLYMGGLPAADLGDHKRIIKLWWSEKGNNYAYSTSNSLVFSSGQSFPAPVELKGVEENGQYVLKWLNLQDGRKFVLYQKAL